MAYIHPSRRFHLGRLDVIANDALKRNISGKLLEKKTSKNLIDKKELNKDVTDEKICNIYAQVGTVEKVVAGLGYQVPEWGVLVVLKRYKRLVDEEKLRLFLKMSGSYEKTSRQFRMTVEGIKNILGENIFIGKPSGNKKGKNYMCKTDSFGNPI